jgi:SAM-dependent methyltransferase
MKKSKSTVSAFTDDSSISVHRMLYAMRQHAALQNTAVHLTSFRVIEYRFAAYMYFSQVKYLENMIILGSPKFISNAIDWGEYPDIYGPRDYFRNMLIWEELKKQKDINTILDYGCGVGNMLMFLARNGYSVTGMDISKIAVGYVKKLAASSPASGHVRVREGTFKTVHIPPGSFDAVWCGEVLEHTPDDVFEVKNFYRILKDGGRCFVSVPHELRYWSDIDEYWGHYRRYSEKEITALFGKCGFIVERIIVYGFPLARLWDAVVYNHIFRKQIKQKTLQVMSPTVISRLLKNRFLVHIVSLVFYFDQLWNWTKRGKGIILVARKAEK